LARLTRFREAEFFDADEGVGQTIPIQFQDVIN